MKKFVIFGVILAMIILFTLPTMIFAEPGDNSKALGDEADGQYIMNPLDTDYDDPPESVPDPENDRMEVYCIDEDVDLDGSGFVYEETDIDVSDELIANGEDPDVAEAVEIMATTATGADNGVNQDVVWDMLTSLTGTDRPITLDTTGQAVKAEVLALADKFNNLPENTDADLTNDVALQDFLDAEGINDLDVYLDTTTPFIESDGTTNNTFVASAEMDNPLVPGVTDVGTDIVFWYILAGSYNVSFASNSLVTEATSSMADIDELGNDIADPADSGYVASKADNWGKSTINYYFFWWGDGFPEYEAMNVNIGASVDIDKDGMIDKEQGADLDKFKAETKVVKVVCGEVVKTGGMLNANGDPDVNGTIPAVETFVPENIDVDYYNAGKILVAEGRRNITDCQKSVYEDVKIPTYWTTQTWHPETIIHHDGYRYWCFGWHTVPAWDEVIPGYYTYSGRVNEHWVNGAASITKPAGFYGSCKIWQEEEIIHPAPYYQRFAIESYSEPSGSAEHLYSRWLGFTVNKTDSTNPGLPVAGATYKLTYDGGREVPNSYPYETEFTAVTGANGQANFTGLPWGFYTLIEESAPAGYLIDTGSYDVGIGGDIFFQKNQAVMPDPYGYINVTNDPIPGTGITTTKTTAAKKITVAGLTEGIQVLAFTGLDPIIPLSGAGALAGGLGLLIASLKTRRNKK